MIDLEDKVEDIVDIYIERLYHTDKTVGVIVSKDIAEYILDNLVKLDDTSIKEVDFIDYININEYLVSVDNDGCITVIPIEDFGILDATDIFYIDMDGDIKQEIIDYCVNEDKKVILFGQDDTDDECDGECDNCPANENSSAVYKVNGKEVSEDEYYDRLADVEEAFNKLERLERLYRIFW